MKYKKVLFVGLLAVAMLLGSYADVLAKKKIKVKAAPSLGYTLLSAAPSSAGAVTLTHSSITGNVGSTGELVLVTSVVSGAVVPHVPAQIVTDFDNLFTATQSLPCSQTLTGTLAGITLGPGVYCFDAAATLAGTLTLSGSATDTWVFKVASALTATDFTVNMAGGAVGCNVTWVSGSATTITRGDFKGTSLSGSAFTATGTATTGSDFVGQAMSKGAVTATDMRFTGCT
jgi:hypothetical protein